MYSKIKILGHPVHPMLIPYPIAFYTGTLVSFIIYAVGNNPFWFRAAVALNVAGVGMALIAAIVGFTDFALGIPSGTEVKKDGYRHMGFNVLALILFAVCLGLNVGQWSAAAPDMTGGIILSALGFLSTIAAGYYGWTLVQTHHVGVQLTPAEEAFERKTAQRHRRAA